MVIHLMSKNRFFTAAKYLLPALTASRRICLKCKQAFASKRTNMMMALRSPCRLPWSKVPFWLGLGAMIFWLGAMSSSLMADGTNTAPAQPRPASGAGGEDFAAYVAAHQKDLTPFIHNHGDDLIKQAVPVFLGGLRHINLLHNLVGWGVGLCV